ncbi:CheR family methyltransferase [Marispirochaeta sp.]|uniref:CheR family methyltransferase n=1 Tax=Marispirochaeta sp. TaxID=2038653 RepID=UPI0029C62B9E|nr:CheR family methyltransferase [Marispirochaeta sp.]
METLQEQQKGTEKRAAAEQIDFKMVTFSLAGKEYGIDIMKVKEISKADRFTYVPNTAPYVRGVYNLRGDIISIIDLRVMFHLPASSKADGLMEDMIILRLENYFIGVIVDNIDKVVGITSSSIQPPHPLFGDINIKFIKGIVENEKKLYIILDVEKILGDAEEDDDESRVEVMGIPMASDPDESTQPVSSALSEGADLGLDFLQDTLKTFSRFTVSSVNREWVRERYAEWKSRHGGSDEKAQLKSPEDAKGFLEDFFSPYTGRLWNKDYADALVALLPENRKGNLTAWNPGCGKGYETYSLAAALKARNPAAVIKIWANDSDLLSISTAPNLVFSDNEIPEYLDSFMQQTKNGKQFSDEIKKQILFEYHDVLHSNPFPEVDLILARDLISFMSKNDQNRLMNEFSDKLKPGGLLFLGANERIDDPDWELVEASGLVAYRKKNG